MKTRPLLLSAAAFCALTASANATTINGWYIGLEGGANWLDDVDQVFFETNGAGVVTDIDPATASFDTGWAVIGTVGYGWNNWRFELEGGYRSNDGDFLTPFAVADVDEATLMVNLVYDIPLTDALSLSLGGGAGADFAMYDLHSLLSGSTFEDEDWNFAYQGIAGLNYALGPHTTLVLNYRYLRVLEPEFDFRPAVELFVESDDFGKHTATIGLRYAFGAPPPPEPAVAPPPPPPPPAEAPKQFIIFFGFNKCNITAEADNVLSEAATAAKSTGSAMIEIVGHTDTSGSNKYNQKLSECRADAAKSNLVGKGIPAGSITATGKGETELMVQTGDNVREPQNRRAHINLQ